VVLRMKLTGSAMMYSTIRHMLVAQNIDLVRQDNAVKSSTERQKPSDSYFSLTLPCISSACLEEKPF